MRKKLIEMVFEEGISIYQATKRLEINYSTGKTIVKNYRSKGQLFRRNYEKSESELRIPPGNERNISEQNHQEGPKH